MALVLMDIMMPEMDGYEAITAIRTIPRYTDLPILVLSAKAIPGERAKVLALGATEYRPKSPSWTWTGSSRSFGTSWTQPGWRSYAHHHPIKAAPRPVAAAGTWLSAGSDRQAWPPYAR